MIPAVAPVEARLQCGGDSHRLRWADGVLHALDHPDAAGEDLLVALGADRPECLEVLAAWDAHRNDVRVLTLGPRHGDDRPVIDAAAVDAVRTGQFATNLYRHRAGLARMPPQRGAGARFPHDNLDEQEDHLRRHLQLLRLFTLPAALQQRLCVTVAAAWLVRDADCPALQAALVGRAGPALRAWAGDGAPVQLTVGPGLRVNRVADGTGISAELPTRWLVDVWGRGVALLEGHFVLDVVDDGQVRAVAPDGTVVIRPISGAAPSRP